MPLILQIDAPLDADVIRNVAPGVYEYKLFGVLEAIWGNIKFKFEKVPMISPGTLTSVRVVRDELTPVTDLQDTCWNGIPGSYYYNNVDGAMTFNVAEYKTNSRVGWRVPWGKRIEIGIIVGASDSEDMTREDGIMYSGVKYPPLLDEVPEITRQRDNTTFGVTAFNESTVTQSNITGRYNGTAYKGCLIRLIDVPNGGELSAGKIILSGIITEIARSRTKYATTIGDKRYQLENTFTTGALTKEQFPDISDKLIGKHFPFAWGKIENYKPFKLNGNNKTGTDIECCFCAAFDGSHKPKRVDKIFFKHTDGDDREYSIDVTDLCQTTLMGIENYRGAAYFTAKANSGTYFKTYKNGVVDGEQAPSVYSDDDTTSIAAGATSVKLSGGDQSRTASNGDVIFCLYKGTVHRWVVKVDKSTNPPEPDPVADEDGNIIVNLVSPISEKMDIEKITLVTITHETEFLINYFGWHNTKAGETEYLPVTDIAKNDMLAVFGGFQDNDFYMNVESWERERMNALKDNRKISYLIDYDDSNTTINDALTEIFTAADGCFNTDADSRFASRLLNFTSSASFEITEPMLLEDPEETESDDIFSSVIIEYGPAGDSENKLEYLDDSREEEILSIYKNAKREKFTTCLETLDDAKKKAKTLLDRASTPPRPTTFVIVYDRVIASKNPGDYFIAPRDQDGNRAYYEISEITVNKPSMSITISGMWRANILYESGYIQGTLMGDGFMGDTLMSVTTEEE